MTTGFYIVDDDKTVRKILERIIVDHDLGEVAGTAEDGVTAMREIVALSPAVALVDLLLPGVDGITLVRNIKADCPQTCFIMLSQVADKDMVGKAYQAGVDLFINKPINVIEVVSVIRQAHERMTMRNILQSLRVTIGGIAHPELGSAVKTEEELRRKHLKNILAKLGILGESGSQDIADMCLASLDRSQKGGGTGKMGELYSLIAKKYVERGIRINAASVEQRVRRAMYKALNNTANLGLEDYGNEFFVAFGSSFFDFTEVRNQMNYLRGTSEVQGKINVKKFIEGLAMQVQDGS